jgi:predicted nucleotidyltransferase
MIIEKDRQIAEELKQRFLAADGDRILRVILYGSRAQGSATEESDFDFLVVEKDPVLKRQEMRRLRQAVADLDCPVDVWVMGEHEFEETREVIGGLAYPAHKYGIVLYENPEAVRELMAPPAPKRRKRFSGRRKSRGLRTALVAVTFPHFRNCEIVRMACKGPLVVILTF